MDRLPARRGQVPSPIPPETRVTFGDMFAALLTDAKCENTRLSRGYDIDALTVFLGSPDPASACVRFLGGGKGHANALGLAFRQHERDRGMSCGTCNRRLATLRRLVKLARRFDLITWEVTLDELKDDKYVDTRGPGRDGWRTLWAYAEAAGESRLAVRDRLMLRLLHDNALRSCELHALDVADVDLEGNRIAIKGKGHHERSWVTIPPAVVKAMRQWLAVRGSEPGPLFTARRGRWKTRMSLKNCWRRVLELAEQAGLGHVKPHGLRHQAITRVLELTNGNIRHAQRFARHAKPETTMKYDDNRTDIAGDMSRLLSDDD